MRRSLQTTVQDRERPLVQFPLDAVNLTVERSFCNDMRMHNRLKWYVEESNNYTVEAT